MKKRSDSDIATEQQLDVELARHSGEKIKLAYRQQLSQRLTGVFVIVLIVASYLQWHYSKGEETYLYNAFLLIALVYLLFNAVIMVIKPKV